ncbi:hypothetical protein SAMN05192558_108332 [Actinokineospora alba]|uniref:Uncharacterized protein n=1 Tax=Actinokineospora alba TaxID=504798 RepID=A0A1H0SA06_9PSEU|nr:hypothetical protein [Actinokineospora alba]TDP66717.1 hypothetical protein C8E96_2229 [Actinokineospora alba]SDI51174.1 hypothetical protein SAMN05421871_105343 [Actinokineospora alba]SDP37996.1 hypothetical protein SAMN05192558_108332 [Actinokineospora alba]
MDWEIERHDWAPARLPESMRSHYAGVPAAIRELVHAPDRATANRLVFRIDNVVVIQGNAQPGAAQACACLVSGLVSATPAGRTVILELLFQIGGGAAGPLGKLPGLYADIRAEVVRGFPLYAEYLETGSRADRFHCIDLLWVCAVIDPTLTPRVRYLYSRVSALGEDYRRAAEAKLPPTPSTRAAPTIEAALAKRRSQRSATGR